MYIHNVVFCDGIHYLQLLALHVKAIVGGYHQEDGASSLNIVNIVVLLCQNWTTPIFGAREQCFTIILVKVSSLHRALVFTHVSNSQLQNGTLLKLYIFLRYRIFSAMYKICAKVQCSGKTGEVME